MKNRSSLFMTNLKKIRKARGLSQQELADKCGVSKNTISYYETKVTNPPIDKIEKVANALGVPVGQLLSENTRKKQEYEDTDLRLLRKLLKIKSLPKKDQKNIWEYIKTIIENYELNKQRKGVG